MSVSAEPPVVAVTGGRSYPYRDRVFEELDRTHKEHKIGLLVHGGAAGVDSFAAAWADQNGIQTAVFPVTPNQWSKRGRGAGPKRNALMLQVTSPHLLIAFPGNNGTSNCVDEAAKQGVRVVIHK